MKLLLDTYVLIDHLRGRAGAVNFLLAANERGDDLVGSVVSRSELLRGMRPSERTRTEHLLTLVSWLEVTVAIADKAGELARRYRASHPGIDIADFLIAGTCDLAGAQLATLNVKHFPMLPGLERAYE
jgi:predicted nucleic acid-binding protein